MINIKSEILEQKKLNPPASAEDIQNAEKELNKNLPDDYKNFLSIHNGGVIKTEKIYLQLWKVQDLAKLNQTHKVSESLGDFVIFGTDGGNEAFTFDYGNDKCSVVNFPLIPITIEKVKEISPNFEEFLNTL